MLITKPVGNGFSSLTMHSPLSQVSPALTSQLASSMQASCSPTTQLPSTQVSPLSALQSSSIKHLAVIQLSQSIPPQSTSSSSASNSPLLQCSAPGQLISPMQSESLQSIKLSSSSSILLSHISIVSFTFSSGVSIIPETNAFSKSFPCRAIKAIEVSLALFPQCPSAVTILCK